MRLGVLTDIHLVADVARRASWHNAYDFAGVEDRCRRAIRLFAREGVEAVLLLGDLAHDGDLASLRRLFGLVRPGPPLVAVAGNHDGPRPSDQLAAAAGDSLRLPGWRALRGSGLGAGRRSEDEAWVAGVRVVRRARGGWASARPPATRNWGDRPVLLLSHFPLLSRRRALGERGLPYAGDLVDRAQLAEAVARRSAPTVAACGHLHVRDGVASGSLLQLGFGALVEPPFEASVIEVSREGGEHPAGSLQVERQAHELDQAPERRDPRLAAARARWCFRAGTGWSQADE